MNIQTFPMVLHFDSGREVDVEVEFEYTPAEKETRGFDGGTPATPESFDDVQVILPSWRGRYITKFLTTYMRDQVDTAIKEYIQLRKERDDENYDHE